jgi:hypothetical protein
MLKSQITGTTIAEDQFKVVASGKMTRVEAIQPTLHPGKFFGSGSWNESFMDQARHSPMTPTTIWLTFWRMQYTNISMTRTLMFLIVKIIYVAQIFHCFIIWFFSIRHIFRLCVFLFLYIKIFLHKFVKTSKESGRIF